VLTQIDPLQGAVRLYFSFQFQDTLLCLKKWQSLQSNLLSKTVWDVAQYQSLASAASVIHLAGTGDVARHFPVAHAGSTPARFPDSAVQQ